MIEDVAKAHDTILATEADAPPFTGIRPREVINHPVRLSNLASDCKLQAIAHGANHMVHLTPAHAMVFQMKRDKMLKLGERSRFNKQGGTVFRHTI